MSDLHHADGRNALRVSIKEAENVATNFRIESRVEVACTLAVVRDSKNPTGPMLTAEVRQLVSAVKGGQLGASPA